MRKIPALEAQLKTITLRHAAAEQLIGEKEDELEDLRTDLQHVKQMFRQQVGDLLDEIAKLKASGHGHSPLPSPAHAHSAGSANSLQQQQRSNAPAAATSAPESKRGS